MESELFLRNVCPRHTSALYAHGFTGADPRNECFTVMTLGLIGGFGAFRPKGRVFESGSSRLVGSLGKSFTHSSLWRFGVKLRNSIRAVSGALRSSVDLKRRYRNSLKK